MAAKHHNPRFLALVESIRGGVAEIAAADVQAMLDRGERFVLLDVREDHEWTQGHLPSAQHLGRGILERDVETRFPDVATPLVLYCGGGFRSALAAETLVRMGYTNVRSLAGGWRGWVDEGRKVTTG